MEIISYGKQSFKSIHKNYKIRIRIYLYIMVSAALKVRLPEVKDTQIDIFTNASVFLSSIQAVYQWLQNI